MLLRYATGAKRTYDAALRPRGLGASGISARGNLARDDKSRVKNVRYTSTAWRVPARVSEFSRTSLRYECHSPAVTFLIHVYGIAVDIATTPLETTEGNR